MGVAEHGEAVDDDGGIADHGDYLFGFEFFVGVVADGEDDGIDTFERGFKIFADAEIGKTFLVAEKAKSTINSRLFLDKNFGSYNVILCRKMLSAAGY